MTYSRTSPAAGSSTTELVPGAGLGCKGCARDGGGVVRFGGVGGEAGEGEDAGVGAELEVEGAHGSTVGGDEGLVSAGTAQAHPGGDGEGGRGVDDCARVFGVADCRRVEAVRAGLGGAPGCRAGQGDGAQPLPEVSAGLVPVPSSKAQWAAGAGSASAAAAGAATPPSAYANVTAVAAAIKVRRLMW